MRAVIKCNVCPLVEPYVGVCWVCDEDAILVAHDIEVDESLCMDCVNHAIIIDDSLQRVDMAEDIDNG